MTTSTKKKEKINVKKRLSGKDLDLSTLSLEEVPIQQLMALKRVTRLDISCNLLLTIPEGLCNLQLITKLDLSNNLIDELPSNFGNLVNLRRLDLSFNMLYMLPVSFRSLKNLRWLNLCNNPMDPQLKAIVDECEDYEMAYLECARSIVVFMAAVYRNLMRDKERIYKLMHEHGPPQIEGIPESNSAQQRLAILPSPARKYPAPVKSLFERGWKYLGDTFTYQFGQISLTMIGAIILVTVILACFLTYFEEGRLSFWSIINKFPGFGG